jgi:hypothetical protein
MKFRDSVQQHRADPGYETKFKIRQATESYFAGRSFHDTRPGNYYFISVFFAMTCGFASGIVGNCIVTFLRRSDLLNHLKDLFLR